MIRVEAQGALLDIEGTTSAIRFVYDEMFPFVRRELERFLDQHGDQPAVRETAELIAQDGGADSLQGLVERSGATDWRSALAQEVYRQMDADLKATGLKQLQGLIWRDGFESGELRAHVYDDVVPALQQWKAKGVDLRVYSSGSVAAQKLFFGHTICGDLLSFFSGHYDTTFGGKKSAESYRDIAAQFQLPPQQILFISDVTAELSAAAEAGMKTCLSCRPDNPPQEHADQFPQISSFAEIELG